MIVDQKLRDMLLAKANILLLDEDHVLDLALLSGENGARLLKSLQAQSNSGIVLTDVTMSDGAERPMLIGKYTNVNDAGLLGFIAMSGEIEDLSKIIDHHINDMAINYSREQAIAFYYEAKKKTS